MYAQSVTVTSDGIYYEYAYDNTPVTIVEGVYHWYVYYNDAYYWRPLPRQYYGFVHHFDRPRYYMPNHYRPQYRPRQHNNGRPPMRPNIRPDRKPDARPNIRPQVGFTPRSSQPQRFGGNNAIQRNSGTFKYSYSFDGRR